MTLYRALIAAGGKVPEDGAFQIDDHHLADFRSWQARQQLKNWR
jgi:hypothetical protein